MNTDAVLPAAGRWPPTLFSAARSPHASPPTAERETRGRGFFTVPVSLASGCFSELRKQTRFPDTQRINGDGGARTFVNKEALLKY